MPRRQRSTSTGATAPGTGTAAPGRPATQAGVLAAHQRAGRHFQAAGVRSFVRDQGEGPAVLCIHGMIGSSFLYRKVLAELAARGLRGVAFDLPGFGLAARPRPASSASTLRYRNEEPIIPWMQSTAGPSPCSRTKLRTPAASK